MHSRPLDDICCLTQAALFNFCLTDGDLRELGAWREEANAQGFSPALWSRALLHRRCSADPAQARRVSDRLDVRHMDAVILVRNMDEDAAERLVDLWVERPCRNVLPGLLWALSSDARGRVSALGARLGHEAGVVAGRVLLDEGRGSRKAEEPHAW